MKKYIGLLLVVVILLLVAFVVAKPHTDGTTPSTEGTTSTGETKDTVPEDQNGTTATTNETTATTEGSGETNRTEPTGGDSSSTGTTETTHPPTDAPTVPPTTPPTTPPTENTVPAEYTLKISQSTLSLEVGQIGNLTAEYTGTGTLTWKSSDTSKATVSNGKVTAKSAGTVVITVTDGVKSSQCMVTITKPEPPKEVTLKLSKSSLDLKVGGSETLSVTYTGDKSLSWTSSNTAVATVKNGKVTAVSAGNAVISVTDGVKTVQCRVTVTNAAAPIVVNLTVSPTSLNLVVGNTSTLTASYNGTGTLSWSSSNTSVVTVSNGKVTAKAAGNAVVTVSDGNKSATCSITVTAPATAKTFTFNTQNNTTITAGNTFQIDYSYSGSNSELTWSSTDSSVLTVNNSGVVTAKAKGAATVKVTNGEKTWRLSIRVEDARPAATSFVYSNQNAPLYDGVTKYAGDYMTFKVNVQPDASNPNITVTSNNTSAVSVSWKLNSSDINEVTLNFNGAGTATVTITSADGAYFKSYTITVKSGYDCNPGGGQLTPEQFVNAYNGVVRANGMSTSGMPSGYLVLTLSPSELTWAKAKREAEGGFHSWWKIGYRTMVLTYEGTDENGNYIFYERGC